MPQTPSPWIMIEQRVRRDGWNDAEVNALKRRYYQNVIEPDAKQSGLNPAEQKAVARQFWKSPLGTDSPEALGTPAQTSSVQVRTTQRMASPRPAQVQEALSPPAPPMPPAPGHIVPRPMQPPAAHPGTLPTQAQRHQALGPAVPLPTDPPHPQGPVGFPRLPHTDPFTLIPQPPAAAAQPMAPAPQPAPAPAPPQLPHLPHPRPPHQEGVAHAGKQIVTDANGYIHVVSEPLGPPAPIQGPPISPTGQGNPYANPWTDFAGAAALNGDSAAQLAYRDWASNVNDALTPPPGVTPTGPLANAQLPTHWQAQTTAGKYVAPMVGTMAFDAPLYMAGGAGKVAKAIQGSRAPWLARSVATNVIGEAPLAAITAPMALKEQGQEVNPRNFADYMGERLAAAAVFGPAFEGAALGAVKGYQAYKAPRVRETGRAHSSSHGEPEFEHGPQAYGEYPEAPLFLDEQPMKYPRGQDPGHRNLFDVPRYRNAFKREKKLREDLKKVEKGSPEAAKLMVQIKRLEGYRQRFLRENWELLDPTTRHDIARLFANEALIGSNLARTDLSDAERLLIMDAVEDNYAALDAYKVKHPDGTVQTDLLSEPYLTRLRELYDGSMSEEQFYTQLLGYKFPDGAFETSTNLYNYLDSNNPGVPHDKGWGSDGDGHATPGRNYWRRFNKMPAQPVVGIERRVPQDPLRAMSDRELNARLMVPTLPRDQYEAIMGEMARRQRGEAPELSTNPTTGMERTVPRQPTAQEPSDLKVSEAERHADLPRNVYPEERTPDWYLKPDARAPKDASEAVQRLYARLQEIDARLKNPNMSPATRSQLLNQRAMIQRQIDQVPKTSRNPDGSLSITGDPTALPPGHSPDAPWDLARLQDEATAIDLEMKDLSKEWSNLQSKGQLTPEKMRELQERRKLLRERQQGIQRQIDEQKGKDDNQGGDDVTGGQGPRGGDGPSGPGAPGGRRRNQGGWWNPFERFRDRYDDPSVGKSTRPGETVGPSQELEASHWLRKFDISDPVRHDLHLALTSAALKEGGTHNPATGKPLEPVPFRQMIDEARKVNPGFVARVMKEGLERNNTIPAPERLVMEDYLRQLVGKIDDANRRLEADQGKMQFDDDALSARRREIDRMEKDAKGIIDILYKARSQDGRNLAFHRILVDQVKASDASFWLNRANREAGGKMTPHTQQRITQLTAKAKVIEDRLAELKGKGLMGGPVEPRGRTPDPEIARLEAELKQIKTELAIELSKAGRSTFLDVASATWKAGLLSGIKTTGRNLTSNATFGPVLEEISRIPGSGADWLMSLVTGNRTYQGASLPAMGRAFNEARTRGMKEAGEIMRFGSSMEDMEKLSFRKEINTGHPRGDGLINGIFRFYNAQDRVFKAGAFRRSIDDQAAMLVKTMRRQDRSIDSKAEFKRLRENPTPEMIAQAVYDAEVQTFTNANKLASGFKSQGKDPFTRWILDQVMPFTNTPANVLARILDYTVVGGAFRVLKSNRVHEAFDAHAAQGMGQALKRLAARLEPGEQRAIATAFGRGATGLGLIMLGGSLYEAGRATGLYQDDPGDRGRNEATGRPPDSVKVGGFWHRIGSISPIGNLINLGATLRRDAARPETWGMTALKTVTDQPMLTGARDILEGLSGDNRDFEHFAGRYLSSYVPTIVGDVAQLVDGQQVKRSARGVGAQIRNKIPGAREGLPIDHDPLGREMETSPLDSINPFLSRRAREDEDPFYQELASSGVPLGLPNRRVSVGKGQDYKLPEEDFQEYVRQSGPKVEAQLRRLVKTERWKRMDDEERSELVAEIAQRARKQTRNRLKRSWRDDARQQEE